MAMFRALNSGSDQVAKDSNHPPTNSTNRTNSYNITRYNVSVQLYVPI